MQMMQAMQEFDVGIKRNHIKRFIFILSLHGSFISSRRKLKSTNKYLLKDLTYQISQFQEISWEDFDLFQRVQKADHVFR